MDTKKIKELAFELYKNEEVAIELANIIFGIRDGDFEPKLKYPLYVKYKADGEIAKYTSLRTCTIVWSESGNTNRVLNEAIPHTDNLLEPIAFNEERQLWDKAPIWCWDDKDSLRCIRFYDAKNDCIFSYKYLRRNGVKFKNYELVDRVPEWMYKAHKKLEE